MAGPTPSWGTVPVFGTWLLLDGTPVAGKVRFTLPQRITNAPGDVIFPRNGVLEFALGAETGSINFDCPILDDPDNFPDDASVQILVEEIFVNAVNASYYIRPVAAMSGNTPPGLDLRTVVVVSDNPAAPPPSLIRGVPGGVAALDTSGNVLDGAGHPVVGGVASVNGHAGTVVLAASDVGADATGAAAAAQSAAATYTNGQVSNEASARATAITAAINALVNSAPGALDTLKELADALGDDANFATTITNALALKAPLASAALTGSPTINGHTPVASDQVSIGVQTATEFALCSYVSNGGGSVSLSTTPSSVPLASTAGWPTSGSVLFGTGAPGGSTPTRVIATYTGISGSSLTGVTIPSGTASVPDATQAYYATSGLSNGTLMLPNQILTGTGSDGRPHDLVLVAAFDPSGGHVQGDYDIVLTRQAGSFGHLQLDLPVSVPRDLPITDGLGNVLLQLAAGSTAPRNNNPAPQPTGQILVAGTLTGAQGANKNLVLALGAGGSQLLIYDSAGVLVATLDAEAANLALSANGTSSTVSSLSLAGGRARFRFNAGTIVIDDGSTQKPMLIQTASVTFQNDGVTTSVGVVIKQVASQSGDSLQIQKSDATRLLSVDSTGQLKLSDGTFADNSPRPPAWQSGRIYYLPNGPTATSNTLGNGTIRATQFWVPAPCTITRLGAEITVVGDSGSKLRLGIYADDGTGRPGNLVIDAGVIAADSATVQEVTISQALSRGWYWASAAIQGVSSVQPTVRLVTSSSPATDGGSSHPPSAAAVGVGWNSSTAVGTLGTALPGSFSPSSLTGNVPRLYCLVQ